MTREQAIDEAVRRAFPHQSKKELVEVMARCSPVTYRYAMRKVAREYNNIRREQSA